MISYVDIKFGNSVGHQITDPIITKTLITKIYSIAYIARENALKKNDIIQLKKFRYLVSYDHKNITKAILYIVKYNNVNLSIYIYNSNVVIVNYNFTPDCYTNEGIILYGELYHGKNSTYYFIINDLHKTNDLITKLKILNDFIRYKYEIDEFDTHIITLSEYVDYPYIKSLCNDYLINHKYLCPTTIIGLKFRYNDIIYKHNYLYENKPITRHIHILSEFKTDISYIIKMCKSDKPDIYNMYYNNNLVGIADIPDLPTSTFVHSMFPPMYQYIYLYCKYNIINNRWIPISYVYDV